MKKKAKNKILILGAGLAGLGAGIQARKLGYETLILEKENFAGGLFSNNSLDGCDFDYGPKILVDTPNTQKILSFMKSDFVRYPHAERAYLSEYGLLNFPLQRNLHEFPTEEKDKILSSLLNYSSTDQITNFREWLIYNYGEYFSNRYLIPYEEKKWLTALDEMDYQWALNRHLKVNKEEILQGSVAKPPTYRWYY